jgi:hypothetical protein
MMLQSDDCPHGREVIHADRSIFRITLVKIVGQRSGAGIITRKGQRDACTIGRVPAFRDS